MIPSNPVSCRASDYSIALPDLEVDPEAQMEIEREVVGAPVLVSYPPSPMCLPVNQKSPPQRTMSDNVNDPPPVLKPDVASQDVLVRKEEVRVIKRQFLASLMTKIFILLGSERHGTSQAEDSGGKR